MYLNEYFRPLVVGGCGFDFYTQGFGGGEGGDWYILVSLLIKNRNREFYPEKL